MSADYEEDARNRYPMCCVVRSFPMLHATTAQSSGTGFCLATLGGGVNPGTHPPRILAYPQTDKCPTPPPRGGGGLTPTHPPTYPTPAQTTKHPSPFMGVGQTQRLWGSSVAPFASSTNDKAS